MLNFMLIPIMEGDCVNVVYMVDNNDVTEIDLGKFKNINRKVTFKAGKQDLQKIGIGNIHVNLRSKKVYVVIEGEEIYIKYFDFPRVNDNKLYELINNELNYLYRNEKFIFNYKKIKQSSKSIEVAVFYLRAENLNSINKLISTQELKAVRLIQFCFFNYYKEIIKEKDYFMFFKHSKSGYMIFVRNSSIYANEVYCISEDKEYDRIKKFFFYNYTEDSPVKKIFVVGGCIKDKSIIEFFEKYGEVNFLDDIDESKMAKLIM